MRKLSFDLSSRISTLANQGNQTHVKVGDIQDAEIPEDFLGSDLAAESSRDHNKTNNQLVSEKLDKLKTDDKHTGYDFYLSRQDQQEAQKTKDPNSATLK